MADPDSGLVSPAPGARNISSQISRSTRIDTGLWSIIGANLTSMRLMRPNTASKACQTNPHTLRDREIASRRAVMLTGWLPIGAEVPDNLPKSPWERVACQQADQFRGGELNVAPRGTGRHDQAQKSAELQSKTNSTDEKGSGCVKEAGVDRKS
jgi:hypothetical protein